MLIPWIECGGFTYQRQVSCAVAGQTKPQRGRIDLLVFAGPQARPVTLIESKRQISGDQDLQRAVAQATGYARSLGLPSFVVAAPRGLWIYRRINERASASRTSLVWSCTRRRSGPSRSSCSCMRTA